MIKNWNSFISEKINNPDSVIDAKMSEIRDMIDGISDGNNIVYEWENKEDRQLTVSFSANGLSIRYDFDIDDLYVTKQAGDVIDFEKYVESVDDGLNTIEEDIHSILGVSEHVSIGMVREFWRSHHHTSTEVKNKRLEVIEEIKGLMKEYSMLLFGREKYPNNSQISYIESKDLNWLYRIKDEWINKIHEFNELH